MHLNEHTHAHTKLLIMQDSWLELEPRLISRPAELSQGGQTRQQHLCLAASKPEMTVILMYRPSVFLKLNNGKAVDFVEAFDD